MKNFNDFLNQSLLHSKINYNTNSFNPFEYPPKIEICEQHLQATNFSSNEILNKEKCKCCGYNLNPKKYGIFDSIDKFSENGFGYSLVFYFTIFCIIFLIFPFWFSSIIYMKMYSLGNYCTSDRHFDFENFNNSIKSKNIVNQKRKIIHNFCNKSKFIKDKLCYQYESFDCYYYFNKNCENLYEKIEKTEDKIFNCKPYYFNYLSFPNNIKILKKDGTYKTDNFKFTIYLDYGIFFIMIILIIIWNIYSKNKKKYFDSNRLKLVDFTILVNELPVEVIGKLKNYKKCLKEYLEKIDNKSYKIYDINMGFDIPNYNGVMKKISAEDNILKKKLIKFYLSNPESVNEFDIQKANYDFKKKISEIFDEIDIVNYKKLKGAVFISFLTENDANNFYNKYSNEKNFIYKLFSKKKKELIFNFENKDYKLKIKKAYDPTDIIWENLNYSEFKKFLRKKLNLILGIIICLCFSITIILHSIHKHFYSKSRESHSEFMVAISLSFEIIIFNFSFKFIINKIIHIEKLETLSQQFGKSVVKIYRIQLVNTILSLIGSSIFTYNLFGVNGLIFNFNMYFITKLIISPLLSYLNIFYFKKLYLRNKIKKDTNNCGYVQEDANKIFENGEFSIVSFYSDILFGLSIAILLTSIFPLAIFYNIVLLCLKFIIYKSILINRSNKLINISHRVQQIITKELNFIVFFYVIGVFLRDLIIYFWNNDHEKIKTSTIILFIISFLNLIFNFSKKIIIYSKIWGRKLKKTTNNTYQEMEKYYPYKYSMTNPYDKLIGEINILKKSLV